jgi:putative flippase GtrA
MSNDHWSSLGALVSGLRFGQFLSVGVVGAILDTIVTLSLKEGLTVHPDLAKFVGAECAIVLMFFINEYWTFSEEGQSGRFALLRRLLTSNVVRSGGLAVQLVTFSFVRRLPVSIVVFDVELWKVLPIFIAIGTAFVVNYVAESLFTWRVHR